MSESAPEGLPYLDAITESAPGFLQGPWGQRFLGTFGIMFSAVLEATKQAVFQRFPQTCSQDALAEVGRSRAMPIAECSGLNEDGYRAFLAAAHDTHRLTGTKSGLLLALVRAGYAAPFVYEQVGSGGFYDVLGRRQHAGWERDQITVPYPAANRFWVVLDVPSVAADHATGLWSNSETWDDAELWANGGYAETGFVYEAGSLWTDADSWHDSDPWLNPIPDAEVTRVLALISRFKPAGASFMGVYWILPGGAISGHPVPAQTYPNTNGDILVAPVVFFPGPGA